MTQTADCASSLETRRLDPLTVRARDSTEVRGFAPFRIPAPAQLGPEVKGHSRSPSSLPVRLLSHLAPSVAPAQLPGQPPTPVNVLGGLRLNRGRGRGRGRLPPHAHAAASGEASGEAILVDGHDCSQVKARGCGSGEVSGRPLCPV